MSATWVQRAHAHGTAAGLEPQRRTAGASAAASARRGGRRALTVRAGFGSPLLLTPLKLRQLEVPNRVWMSPMCQYSAPEGVPTEWHLVHLGARATGGCGLIMAEASAVCPEGRISPLDTGIWNEEQQKAWQPITAFIRKHGAVAGIQLAHAGRKASTAEPWAGGKALPVGPGQPGWQALAPSAVPFSGLPVPREMSEADIQGVVELFAAAARRALAAGFQVVEVHMAHGYLLHEFLSPISNKRTDKYGGSAENRMRLPLQVAEAVRAVWPADLPVLVRISATDWATPEDGPAWEIEQSIDLCRKLKDLGIDLIDCSSGGMLPTAPPVFGSGKVPLGFQVPFAERIRHEAGLPTAAVGFITSGQQAEAILQGSQADAVFVARQLLSDPHWALRAAAELGYAGRGARYPLQYEAGRLAPVKKAE